MGDIGKPTKVDEPLVVPAPPVTEPRREPSPPVREPERVPAGGGAE